MIQLGPATRDGLAFNGRPCSGALTTLFQVVDPLHPAGHTGIDIACASGTPLYAPADGFVWHVESNNWPFGHWSILEHKDGYHTLYGHQAIAPPVTIGQVVKAGDLIGYVGSTGYSTGPHLHWGLADWTNPWLNQGKPLLNPLDYLYGEAEQELSPTLTFKDARWTAWGRAIAQSNGHAMWPQPRDELYDYYRVRLPRRDL